MDLFLETLYVFLPAALATLSPQLAAKFKILLLLDKPIDHKKSFRSKRILGDNKTYRGLFVGVLTGAITGLAQFFLFNLTIFKEVSILNYSSIFTSIFSGVLLGFGSILGDSIKSFFKRQVGIKPGGSWVPFDQIDHIIGAYLILIPFYPVHSKYLILGIVIYFVIHVITTTFGYFMGVKKSWI